MYDLGRFEPWGKPLSQPTRRLTAPIGGPCKADRLCGERRTKGSGTDARREPGGVERTFVRRRGAKSRGGRGRLYAAVCRVIVVVGFVLALLLFLGMLGPEEEPLPGAQVGEDMATFYAAEEYDRIMAEWGDSGAARQGANQVYREVLSEWNAS